MNREANKDIAKKITGLADFEKVTVVIFSRNRKQLVQNLIEYWADLGVTILILDGSDRSPLYEVHSNSSKVEFYWEVPLRRRCLLASESIRTEYALILGDDDFVPYSSVYYAFDLLNKNHSLDAIVTTPTEFNSSHVKSQSAHADFALAYSTEEKESLDRLEKFTSLPMDRHFYGFFRTTYLVKVLNEVARNFDSFSEEQWMIFWPRTFEILCVLLGRSRFSKDYKYLKHSIEDVGIFSKSSRVMDNKIHKEIESYGVSWASIFSSEKKRSIFIEGILRTSFTKDSNRRDLAEAILNDFLHKQLNNSQTPIDFRNKKDRKLKANYLSVLKRIPSLYNFSRIIYRTYILLKLNRKEQRKRWSKLKEDMEYFPVQNFVGVFKGIKSL